LVEDIILRPFFISFYLKLISITESKIEKHKRLQNIVALKVTRTLIFFHLHNILKNYGKLTNNIYTCRYGYLTKHTLEYIKCMIEFETLEKLYGIEKTNESN
jgi:hypothetical protein